MNRKDYLGGLVKITKSTNEICVEVPNMFMYNKVGACRELALFNFMVYTRMGSHYDIFGIKFNSDE